MAREINDKAELPVKISLTKFLNKNIPIDVSRLRNCQQSLSTHQRVNILKNVTRSGTTETALHKAAYEDQRAIVKCLLEGLSEVERLELLKIQDEYGNTALHKAATGGHADAVKCIMEILTPDQRKELYNIRNRNRETALSIAEKQNKENVVEYLRSCEASDHSPQDPATSADASAKDDDFVEGKLLGIGSFGSVYLHNDSKANKIVAVKKVILGVNVGVKITREVKALRNEVSIMEELRHERIVQYIRFEEQPNFLCIYMEYMNAGSVKTQLDRSGSLDEVTTKKYTRQTLEGLSYLHREGIIHRDIKGSNILCDGSGNIKLADFGVSKRMVTIQTLTGGTTQNTSGVGTAHWMSPEVINGEDYGRKADIWSTGASIVEMLTTQPPWHKFSSIQATFKIGNLHKAHYVLDPTISEDAENFLALTFKPEKERPTAEVLLQDSWLSNS